MSEEKNVTEEINQESNHPEQNTSEAPEEIFAEAEETETAAETEVSIEDQLQAANKKIAELQSKLEELENRNYRLQADFENARRRARLDLEASEKYRAQSLITNLLPAIDNFERGLQIEAENEQVKSLLQGMEMVYRSLLEALKSEGVEQIEAVGKEFDPNVHQAVMQAAEEGYESNIVIEEFQKGYMLKDRVIRPAMVKVNQ